MTDQPDIVERAKAQTAKVLELDAMLPPQVALLSDLVPELVAEIERLRAEVAHRDEANEIIRGALRRLRAVADQLTDQSGNTERSEELDRERGFDRG